MAEKRFPFVRGGVFDGLGNYLKTRPINVQTNNLNYLFDEKSSHGVRIDYQHGMRVRLGTIFEFISRGIYGGEYKLTQGISGENGNHLLSEPDIFHSENDLYREVKSFRTGGQLKLLDEQMEKYVQIQFPDLQTQMDFPGILKDPKIRFELFRHRIKNLTKKHKDSEIEKLVSGISKGIGFMISMPFSVAYAAYAHLNQGEGGLTYRYEEQRESWYTSIRSSGLNQILAHPERSLKGLGLNPDDFKFYKRKFPKNVILNGNEVSPFPVLIIKESSPKSQLEKLREMVEKRRKRMEEEYPGYNLSYGKVERPRKIEREARYVGDPFELKDPSEEIKIPEERGNVGEDIPF